MGKEIVINGIHWDKNKIKSLIQTDDRAAKRALLRIYEYQTQDEQNTLDTKWRNGVGFNGCDSFILSIYAQKVQKGFELSQKQMELLRRKIVKYSGQIFKIMQNENPQG